MYSAEIHDYYTTILSLYWLNGVFLFHQQLREQTHPRRARKQTQQITLTPSVITIIKVISYDMQLACLLHFLTLP